VFIVNTLLLIPVPRAPVARLNFDFREPVVSVSSPGSPKDDVRLSPNLHCDDSAEITDQPPELPTSPVPAEPPTRLSADIDEVQVNLPWLQREVEFSAHIAVLTDEYLDWE
jgi:hypothetical protein